MYRPRRVAISARVAVSGFSNDAGGLTIRSVLAMDARRWAALAEIVRSEP